MERRNRFARRTTTLDNDDFQEQLKALQQKVEKKHEASLLKQDSVERIQERQEATLRDTLEIAQQYIHHRLYQSKTGRFDVRRLSICQAYTAEVVRLGIEFETAYPSLFLDISKQMRATLSDQKIIAIVIKDFSEAMFRDGKITWFRLISLICLGAAIASDCHRNGYCELIYTIPHIITKEGFNAKATAWIQHNGGWGGINEYIRTNAVQRDPYEYLSDIAEDSKPSSDGDILTTLRLREHLAVFADMPPRVKLALLTCCMIICAVIW